MIGVDTVVSACCPEEAIVAGEMCSEDPNEQRRSIKILLSEATIRVKSKPRSNRNS